MAQPMSEALVEPPGSRMWLRPARPTGIKDITEIHCWIATFRDGTESILLHGIAVRGDYPAREQFRKDVEEIRDQSRRSNNPITLIRIAKFLRVSSGL